MKAHAKVNIFLKITGHKDSYHTLLSRFVKVESLYDTLTFIPSHCKEFTIEGCDGVPTKSNTIYKAFLALLEATNDVAIEEFFQQHKIVVEKKIPSQAGLGGGSSDAAAFLRLTNQLCNLNISIDKLSQIASSVGADIPFFLHDLSSANVSGFGEVVEPFDEAPLALELYTPPVACDTTVVYKTFKKHFLDDINLDSFVGWEQLNSLELLQKIENPTILNDLYLAATKAYPELQEYVRKGWYFSGSGSTFFRPIVHKSLLTVSIMSQKNKPFNQNILSCINTAK